MRFKEFYEQNANKVKNLREIDSRYFYVYRITNLLSKKHYYGSRVSKNHPNKDLGILYFSSSYDKNFINEQKLNPERFKYKIVKICSDNVEKQLFESYLHFKFNVGSNLCFYNKVKQTVEGFDSTGHNYNKGRTLTEETKHKLKVALTGRIVSESTKEKQRLNALSRTKDQNMLRGVKHKGKVVSDSTRKLQSIQRTGAGNHQAKVIHILDSYRNVIHRCNGTFKTVCEENSYPWTTLRKAKNGKKLYIGSNGKPSRNIPIVSRRFTGWSIEYE